MKKIFASLAILSLAFSACGNSTDEVQLSGTDPVEESAPAVEDQNFDAVKDGDFTFMARVTEGDYFVDVLYKDKKIGEFFKDLPEGGLETNVANDYRTYVLETTANYTYIALEPQGLSGYVPFLDPWEVARVNLAKPDFKMLTVNGNVEDVASDDSKVASTMEFSTGISVLDITQALYPNGANIQNFQTPDEFNHAGGARFSQDGSTVAYVALKGPDPEESAVFVIDLATGTQTEFTRRSGQLRITGWEGNVPTVE